MLISKRASVLLVSCIFEIDEKSEYWLIIRVYVIICPLYAALFVQENRLSPFWISPGAGVISTGVDSGVDGSIILSPMVIVVLDCAVHHPKTPPVKRSIQREYIDMLLFFCMMRFALMGS